VRIRNKPGWKIKLSGSKRPAATQDDAIISVLHDKCRRCYRCIRVCPTHALKMDGNKVQVLPERCVYCGACYKLCPHDSITFRDEVDHILRLIESNDQVVACLSPDFPAVLDKGSPGQLVAALKTLGFSAVWETTFGSELVVRTYQNWLKKNKRGPGISTFCPALIYYIEKYAPQLIRDLVPITSPMVATGKVIKSFYGPETKVVFIGSCIARIRERTEPDNCESIDGVMTYDDLLGVLLARNIKRKSHTPVPFDGLRYPKAGLLSIAGGLSECIGLDMGLMNLDTAVRSRSDRAIRAIRQLKSGLINARFLDLLFCDGCIHGPIVDSAIPGPSRPEKVVMYIKSCLEDEKGIATEADFERFASLDLKRSFTPRRVDMAQPREEEIQKILTEMGLSYPNDNLDCGGCGYPTCRKKAIAVGKGLAEMEMCPHYLLTRCHGFYVRLEKAHGQLKHSHEQLQQAQAQLIQTEKLASLGQMAAGVAHELNNPLGTITMFAGMLRRDLPESDKRRQDLDLVIAEAERAAKIVRDLLSFSRKTEVKPGLSNINKLIEEVLSLLIKQSLFHNINLEKALTKDLPATFADPDLLKQVLLNMILNGAQAMEGKGALTIRSAVSDDRKLIAIEISDTGTGIAAEKLDHIFDPFYTTKEKGTGLGLAIVYGIVSRHQGTIDVESAVGKGTTFKIYLPVLDSWEKQSKDAEADQQPPRTGGEGGDQRQDLIG
jgi:two-component system, NtrC family, sensor kinase